MKKILFLVIGVFLLSGCAKMQHLDQLLILKNFSDEQTRLQQYIEQQDKKFEKLLKAIEDRTLVKNMRDQAIVRMYGDPLGKREVEKDGKKMERWNYRYQMKYFESEKVYLYFNEEKRLIGWERVGPNPPDENEPKALEEKKQ
ncbi:MAG TPA: hypothetical protein PKH98_03905 [Candidatus Omnitrophota bacterium]|nr:hypothetical protein [Candidatus Omnitrophota bacterium]